MQSRVFSVDRVHVEVLIGLPENPPAMAISAEGWVPTSGWHHPDLAPWIYIDVPKDRILDLDFVASPPTGFVLQVLSKIAVAQAFPVPAWVRGVRVHTSTNSIEALFANGEVATTGEIEIRGNGLPVPWPFPWWAPRAKHA